MAQTKDQKRMGARDRMAARLLALQAERESITDHPLHHDRYVRRMRTLESDHAALYNRLQELNVACGLPAFTLTRDATWTLGQQDFTFKRNER